ncbi:TPA: PIN-like domain-containing protein, partial [Streptococcus pneumoniae]
VIEMFPEFHQEKLETTDIKDENNLIVVDTNFLLQILELPIDIATKYVDSLKSIKRNLYIPYLVALEFHFNKSNKKKTKKRNADSYFKQVESALNQLKSSVQNTDLIKMDIENGKLKHLIGNLEFFTDDFLAKVNLFVRDEITDKEDEVYKELLNIISDSIGDVYEQEWIYEIEKEGEKRFAEAIPPGFNDENKDGIRKYNGISYHQKYGDLIIWKDILKKATEQPRGDKVIFITNDGESNKKSDLIYKTSNMKVGPSIF